MEKSNGFRIAGFVLGLLSVVSGGLILAILGLIFSLKCKKQLREENKKDGLVTAGIVLSIIGIVKTVLLFMFFFFVFMMALIFDEPSYSSNSYKPRNYSYHSSYYDDYNIDDILDTYYRH